MTPGVSVMTDGEGRMRMKRFAFRNRFLSAIQELVIRFFDDSVGRGAATLAYFLLFSFFPTLMFINSLVGLMNIDPMELADLLSRVLPTELTNMVQGYLGYINTLQSRSLMITGLVLTLYSFSRVVAELTIALNRAHRIEKDRGLLGRTAVSVVFTISMMVSIYGAMILVLLGERVLRFAGKFFPHLNGYVALWITLRFSVIALIMFVLFTFLYYIVPNTRLRIREVVPGAFAAMISWVIISLGFSFYVDNMARYSMLYGSLGALMILMLWLYLTGVVLIMGGELNHVLIQAREKKS